MSVVRARWDDATDIGLPRSAGGRSDCRCDIGPSRPCEEDSVRRWCNDRAQPKTSESGSQDSKSVRRRAVFMAELHSSRSIVFVPPGVRHRDAGAESHSLHPDIDSGIRPLVRTSASSVRTGRATERSFVKRTYRAAALESLMMHRLNFRPLLAQSGSGVLLS